jgi:uncharacterized protein (TIGR02271 family)
MDRDMNTFVPQNGMSVIGADGEKVGDIDGVEQDYFIVRKGFFFPQDHYIPMTAISSYDDSQVYLNVTKDEALEQEWSNPPAAGTTYAETTTVGDQTTIVDDRDAYGDNDLLTDRDGVVVEDTGRVGVVGEPDVATYDDGRDTLAGVETGVDRGVDVGVTRDVDDATIEVHEEELAARTREVERGEVRIDKNVVQEQQTLEVPVTEEEVEVTRRRVDRPVTADDHAFEEGTIEVPLRGEEVEIEKRARVVEEIDVDKAARTHTERVSDTVRREEVTIEGDNVDFDRTNTGTRNNDIDPV